MIPDGMKTHQGGEVTYPITPRPDRLTADLERIVRICEGPLKSSWKIPIIRRIAADLLTGDSPDESMARLRIGDIGPMDGVSA